MKVVALRRNPSASADDRVLSEIFRPEDMRSLIASSDYVVAAMPLTDQARSPISLQLGDKQSRALFTAHAMTVQLFAANSQLIGSRRRRRPTS